MHSLTDRIFTEATANFNQLALEVFRHQYEHTELYYRYCEALKKSPAYVKAIDDIPFLPIEFFKSNTILQQGLTAAQVFESSGTTGSISSKHYVADLKLYERSFITGFEKFYGPVNDYVVLALLPSYLERGNSSLVYMADKLIQLSGKPESGFFLNEFDKLDSTLNKLKATGQKTLLLGVTFGLLDFAEDFKVSFPDLIVMETGGMKGRREELTRPEVHALLTEAFGVAKIHSEYGMTELLSQGYSKGDGIFKTVPWLKIFTRDIYDPFKLQGENKTGAVNVIDLANIHSCSFIATSDLAKLNGEGSFEILGRMHNAELRGCNLMVME